MRLIDVVYIIIMGIIEGITEWLPISSTGHLLIIESLFQPIINPLIFSNAFNEMLKVVIQLGAVMAVLKVFVNQINPLSRKTAVKKIWLKIILASIPAGVIGLLFDDLIDELFFNPIVISITLIFYGVVFLLTENSFKKWKFNQLDDLPYRIAFLIGLSQVLAMIPGTSRSGITILCGMMLWCSKSLSAEFSFLLAIPVMFGASFLKLIKFMMENIFIQEQIILLLIGALIAFIISLIVVKWLVNFIKQKGFKGFGIYRIILGMIILIGVILGWL